MKRFLLSVCFAGFVTGTQSETSPADFPRLVDFDEDAVSALNARRPGWLTANLNLMLLERLGWQGQVEIMPINRINQLLQSEQDVCTFDRIATAKRRETALFSKPVNFLGSFRLYQHQSAQAISAQFLNQNGAVYDLAGMLKAHKAHLLVPLHFSYGTELDEEIEKIRRPQKIDIEGANYVQQLMGMFIAKRGDFVITYPSMPHTFFQGDWPVPVRTYTLAGIPPYITGHIMCANTENNRKWLAQVDRVLTSLYKDPAYLQTHLSFSLPSEHSIIRKAIAAQR